MEDDESIRKILRNEFDKVGILVFESENGEKAMELAYSEHPDLILLDYLMPKMHGMEMLRKLHEDEWGKKVPVILLTNFPDDPKVKEAVKEGKCELLRKSEVKLEDVIKKVKEKIGI